MVENVGNIPDFIQNTIRVFQSFWYGEHVYYLLLLAIKHIIVLKRSSFHIIKPPNVLCESVVGLRKTYFSLCCNLML